MSPLDEIALLPSEPHCSAPGSNAVVVDRYSPAMDWCADMMTGVTTDNVRGLDLDSSAHHKEMGKHSYVSADREAILPHSVEAKGEYGSRVRAILPHSVDVEEKYSRVQGKRDCKGRFISKGSLLTRG